MLFLKRIITVLLIIFPAIFSELIYGFKSTEIRVVMISITHYYIRQR